MKTQLPKHATEQIRIDDEDGIRSWELDRFAAEFGHEVRRIFPIFVVLVDAEVIGYYYAQPQVCIYPAVHPDKLSPRAFYEASVTIVDWTKMSFGNPLWLIEENSPMNDPVILRKVHLQKTPLRVFQVPERLDTDG